MPPHAGIALAMIGSHRPPRVTHGRCAAARLALASVLASMLVAGAAGRAAGDANRDKADQLFAEGRALLSSNLVQACEKFTLSLRYNSEAIGTLLNVAQCDEKLGRIASAFARFTEVRDRAKELGLIDHQRAAESRIAALAPSVPHLAIRMPAPVPETKIAIDDRLIPIEAIGDVTIDPGERVIVISAPGRMPFRATLTVARAEHRTLNVPALAPAVTAARSLRRVGQLATLAGGSAFVTSIGLALYGRHLHNQQIDSGACTNVDGEVRCTAEGHSASDRARTFGTVATWVGGIGLVTAAGGAYLWYRARSDDHHDPQIAIVPALDAHGAGVVAAGRF